MFDNHQHHQSVVPEEELGTDEAIKTAWVRRILRDSIYLWACGEKADDDDNDPKSSDRLIGWLVLFMQGFAYATLIVLAGPSSSADTGVGGSSYLLPSVTGAMYLLVASTNHDLRSGFLLFVHGSCQGHRAFGIGLLIVYGIMIRAAMTVLVSTSNDSPSMVLNAVTVLFIADMDEKAVNFLPTIPEQRMLFWAIESIGISFALSLIAMYHIGDDSPLLERNNVILQTWPTWSIWFLNPTAATVCSYVSSSTLLAVCDFWDEASAGVHETTARASVTTVFTSVFEAIKMARERVRGEPCLFVTLAMWLAQAIPNWFYVARARGFPVAVYFAPSADGKEG